MRGLLWLRRVLSGPGAALRCVLGALILFLPALGTGYVLDDYMHQLSLRPEFMDAPGGPRGSWDLFRFESGETGHWARFQAQGWWPWWSSPAYRVVFFRPLASWLHVLDYRYWPDHPVLVHVHTFLWFAGMLFAAAWLFRRWLGPGWVSALATLLYAVDDGHATLAVWNANRNAPIAASFALAALAAHDRVVRPRDGEAPWTGWKRALPAVLFVLGLMGGETALGATGYLAAHAVFLDPRPRDARLGSLVPWAAVLGVFAVGYRLLGCGASGSGFYIDPFRDPSAFLHNVVLYAPLLLAGQFTLPPADGWALLPHPVAVAASVFSALTLALLFTVVGRRLAASRSREAAVFAVGLCVALLPACATVPGDRLMTLASLGAAGLGACFVGSVVDGASAAVSRGLQRLAVVWVVWHVAFSAVLAPARIVQFASVFGGLVARAGEALPPMDGTKDLVVVHSLNMLGPLYTTFYRMAVHHEPGPRALRLLVASSEQPVRLARDAEDSVVVSSPGGFLAEPFSLLFRGAPYGFTPGQHVDAGTLHATLVDLLPDGRPHTVRFRFDGPLVGPARAWVTWDRGRYVPFAVPAVGSHVDLPAIDTFEPLRD